MNVRSIALSVTAMAVLLVSAAGVSRAQGPLYGKVLVDRVLQPGNRALLIYSHNGDQFETTALTFPCLKIRTPEETQLILHHIGPDYYFDHIWIQGKDYGYEFPLPPSVKAREKEMRCCSPAL